MSTLVQQQPTQTAWQTPSIMPLNEPNFQAWLEKHATRDQSANLLRLRTMRGVTVAVLLVAAILGFRLLPYDVALRFIVAAGAAVMMVESLGTRSFAWAVVFGALALLYNPVLPLFDVSGNLTRLLMVVSAMPFAVAPGSHAAKQDHLA